MLKIKKKIGLWYYSPASANALYPLSKRLKSEGHEVVEYVLSDFASKLVGKEITHDVLKEVVPIAEDLDLMIYNTGSGSEIETNLPDRCKELNIKTVSILDTFWEDGNTYHLRFPVIPDYIICVNETNRQHLLNKIEIEEEKVLVLGNPHFDRLFDLKYRIATLPYKSTYTVTFLSQCDVGGTYQEPTAPLCKKAVLELKDLLDEGIIDKLKIYIHPREVKDFFIENNLEVEKENKFEEMIDSDIVISCGSTPQYEANILGIPTITVKENTDIKERILREDYEPKMNFNTKEKSVDLILNFLQKLVN